MAACDSSLPKHKGLSQVEKFMLSYWFKIRPFKGLSQVEKVMSSYWFKIRHFYSEENGVDMLHPYILYIYARAMGGNCSNGGIVPNTAFIIDI